MLKENFVPLIQSTRVTENCRLIDNNIYIDKMILFFILIIEQNDLINKNRRIDGISYHA